MLPEKKDSTGLERKNENLVGTKRLVTLARDSVEEEEPSISVDTVSLKKRSR